MHLFEDFISLASFEDHPPHLHIELVVNFSLHFLVHQLHELLDDVLEVLNVGALAELVLKGLVETHHVGRFAEDYVAAVARARLLSFRGNNLEDVKD